MVDARSPVEIWVLPKSKNFAESTCRKWITCVMTNALPSGNRSRWIPLKTSRKSFIQHTQKLKHLTRPTWSDWSVESTFQYFSILFGKQHPIFGGWFCNNRSKKVYCWMNDLCVLQYCVLLACTFPVYTVTLYRMR